jgi:methionine-rich copper-binding protein CopC
MPARPRFLTRMATAIAATALTLAAAGVLATIQASSASAHDYLVSSSPAAGSTLSAPIDSVSMTFNDLVVDFSHDGTSAIVQVTGPDADTRHFETGCTTISGRTITAPVALGASGEYTITWRVASADGHPATGHLTFDYLAPATSLPASGIAAATSCAAAGSTPGNSGTGPVMGGDVTATVIALTAVAWVVLAAFRRERHGIR